MCYGDTYQMANKKSIQRTPYKQFPQPRRKVSVDLNATVIDFDNMASTNNNQ